MTLESWLATDPFLPDPETQAQTRAVLAWRRILEKPTVVNFRNSGGDRVGNQTVRIESDSRPTESKSVAGSAPRRKVIIFGIQDHPTLADTDIREGYNFNLSSDPTDRYTVQDIVRSMGEIQAVAEASR